MKTYKIEKKIGFGGQGEVYHVTWKGKSYALKRVKKDTISNGIKENQLVNKSKHPNICSYVHSTVEIIDNETYFSYFMPYYEMGDLYKYNLKNDINTSTLLNISLQISSALEYLHKQEICHRDIKPQNIFLKCENNMLIPVLGDFGTSKMTSDDSLLKTICGTLSFVPPELMEQKEYNGFQADMFSFGATLYHLVTMREDQLYLQIDKANKLKEILDSFSKHKILNDLILKLIKKDPKERLIASEVVRILKDLTEEINQCKNL